MSKIYYAKNRERILARQKAYHIAHKEECNARSRAYHIAHLEEIKARGKTYRDSHREERKAKQREYWNKNREILNAKKRIYVLAHLEEIRVKGRKYAKNHRAERKEYYLKRLYGLSKDEFENIFHQQGKACAICGKKDCNSKELHVDHDHASGAVRGILCSNCNTALGLIKDNPKIAQTMVDYLGNIL